MPAKDRWAQRAVIARTISGGWGGISWRKGDPRPFIYLTDTTQLSAAVSALVGVGFLPANSQVGVLQGRWTVNQLYDWFRYIHTHIRGVRVSMWTLDEYHNRIYYGVEDEAAALDLDRKLAEMHAPCFLVAVDVTGRVQVASSPGN